MPVEVSLEESWFWRGLLTLDEMILMETCRDSGISWRNELPSCLATGKLHEHWPKDAIACLLDERGFNSDQVLEIGRRVFHAMSDDEVRERDMAAKDLLQRLVAEHTIVS